MARILVFWSLLWVCVVTIAMPASAAPPADTVAQQVAAIMDRAESSVDFKAAAREASDLFARVAVFTATSDHDALIETAYARRLLTQLDRAEGLDRVEMLRYLRANPKFGHALAFLIRPGEDTTGIYQLADRLRRERGDQLNEFATLTAAICVVHDEPLERHINENEVHAEDPVELFDYFSDNEKRMLFGLRNVPAELLVYVVDSTATTQEMKWALKQYAGNRAVGKLFFNIQYDTDHFRQGTEKKVTTAGFNLPNILKFGGVCADQAYFAVSVGKSIGVPTAYTRGRSAEVGHAWVGFLSADGNRAVWNFDEGRYEVYQGVKGEVEDPQTGNYIPDSVVSLLGVMIGSSAAEREAAAALIDAARVLREAEASEKPFDPEALTTTDTSKQMRGADKASQLELLEAGLRCCPGYVAGWQLLAELAAGGRLTLDEKKKWSTVLMNLCGDRYPDFTLAVLEPMIATIDDPDEQNQIWNKAGEFFTKRKDLSAGMLMAQGRMWAQHGEPMRAGKCYERVVDKYLNDGPFVLDALDEIESILRQSGKPEQVLTVYDQVWARVPVPSKMGPEFRRQSNWYKIGKRYAERLSDMGYADRASQAESAIKRVTGG